MRTAPNFVKNGWYVGALSEALERNPIRRVMLGEPVVLYRTASGKAVALADRCPHRFAPLSKGEVRGDAIQCPYHGLRYDPQGACVFNPHGNHRIPKQALVKSYPVEEHDGIVWVWMGAAELAAETAAPDFREFFGNGTLTRIGSEFVVNAHYEVVLDNLLDLSHAPFLHPTSLADPDSIQTLRVEVKQEGTTVWANHYAPRSAPTPQFKPFRTCTDPLIDFHAHMRWDAPANLQLDVGITELGRPEAQGLYLHMVHLLTPVDMSHTRYAWIAARNFALDNEAVSKVLQEQVLAAFTTEDEPMIRAVWEAMETPDLLALTPAALPGDAAGIRARRTLKQLRERELHVKTEAQSLHADPAMLAAT